LIACCGPSVTVTPPVPQQRGHLDPERQAAAALASDGKLERAIAAFTALNVKASETRAQTWTAEVDALGALFRCDEVRDLAALIDAKGDAEAKSAAKTAREECGRVATTPTDGAEGQMRGIFHRAVQFEPIEPKDAGTLYAQAWEIAPSLAALLGLARTAKDRGEHALAERTYERALAYAERNDQKARVAIGPVRSESDAQPWVLDVGETSALAAYGRLVVTMDLKTGALRVVASVPEPWNILAGHGGAVVIARDGHARLMQLGIDDALTSMPIELGAGATVFSADGSLVGQIGGGSAVVVDAKTGKKIGAAPVAAEAGVVGFTDARALVVSKPDEICTMAAPTWTCVSSKDLAQNARRPAAIAGHTLAFQPNANTFTIFDLAKKTVITTLQGHFSSVDKLVLWPDASKLVSLSERRTVIWDLATKKRDDRIFTHTDPNFTPDGKRFVEQQGMGALLVRDSATFFTTTPLAVGVFMLSSPLPEISFDRDVKLVVHATFDTAHVDLAARTVQWAGHNYETSGPLLASVTSPDGKWTVSVDGGLIRVNKTTSLEFGPDAAVFTDESGHAYVSGDEASARCVVGDEWLPLDACRDRLVYPSK
jgi:hypothetical protein